MRQVWITKAGPPEVLQVREAADPTAAAGEIAIDVAAAGINFADISARVGLYPDAPPLPTVVGYEISGTVTGVGAGVTGFAPGDRVAGLTRFGGYTDRITIPAAQAVDISDLSFEVAAAVPVTFLTAWIMLVRLGNVRPGERVLVHAAAGGVGQAALDICRWRGAEVFGTASPGKHERLRERGVAHCIDYRSQDFESEVMRLTHGEGVDIVLDAVGGESYTKSYRLLRPLGRLFCFGGSSFVSGERRNLAVVLRQLWRMPSFKAMDLLDKNRGVFGVNLGHLWDRIDLLGPDLKAIFDLVREGTFEPQVDRSFSFDYAPAAHAYIQARKNFGKVLLVP